MLKIILPLFILVIIHAIQTSLIAEDKDDSKVKETKIDFGKQKLSFYVEPSIGIQSYPFMTLKSSVTFDKDIDFSKVDKSKIISELAKHVCLLPIDESADYKGFVSAVISMHIQLLYEIKIDKFKVAIDSIEVKH